MPSGYPAPPWTGLLSKLVQACGWTGSNQKRRSRKRKPSDLGSCRVYRVLVTTSRLQRLVRGILHASGSVAPSGVTGTMTR